MSVRKHDHKNPILPKFEPNATLCVLAIKPSTLLRLKEPAHLASVCEAFLSLEKTHKFDKVREVKRTYSVYGVIVGVLLITQAIKVSAQRAFGECPKGTLEPKVHCGAVGDNPDFSTGIDCWLGRCMGSMAKVDPALVWVLDQEGKRVPGNVKNDDYVVSFIPKVPLNRNKNYELIFSKAALRTTANKPILFENAERALGRFRFCFNAGENAAQRNGAPTNGCEFERELKSRIPWFVSRASRLVVKHEPPPRSDTFTDIDTFMAEAVEWQSPLGKPGRQTLARLTFQDDDGKYLGEARLDCDNVVCFKGTHAPNTHLVAQSCFHVNVSGMEGFLDLTSSACAHLNTKK